MRKIDKIMLITPPYHSGVVESAGVWLNVACVYIAGSLRAAGYSPEIYDAMSHWHGYGEIEERIRRLNPDVVATTAFTAEIVDALKVLKLAKEINPEIVTVIGNVHPSFCYSEVLEHGSIDYIVRGEGEKTMVELMNCINAGDDPGKVKSVAFSHKGKIIATPSREFVHNLDSLPMAWDLIDWSIYTYKPIKGSVLAVVSSSRGCAHRCSFCSQQLFWKRKWRGRSPENFIAELEHLRDTYGVNVVMLADETPTCSQERWEKILDLLIERKVGVKILMETRVDDIIRDANIMPKYRMAGIDHIYIGVESTSQATLDIFKKEIKVEESRRALKLINEQDIVSETSFVLGMPNETTENIRNTVELAKYYNPDLAFFLAIAPWPYSEIYDDLKEHLVVSDYSKYNLVEPVIKPKEMSLDDVFSELGRAAKEFYMYKMNNLDKMSAKKRDFMVKVVGIIAKSSYLASAMKGIMPSEMKKIFKKLQ